MCSCPTPAGRALCHCAACHRNFTSPSAFTDHQTVGPSAGVVCHAPADRGLVLLDGDGPELWTLARRGDGPEARRRYA
jgi:hypothetical protein